MSIPTYRFDVQNFCDVIWLYSRVCSTPSNGNDSVRCPLQCIVVGFCFTIMFRNTASLAQPRAMTTLFLT